MKATGRRIWRVLTDPWEYAWGTSHGSSFGILVLAGTFLSMYMYFFGYQEPFFNLDDKELFNAVINTILQAMLGMIVFLLWYLVDLGLARVFFKKYPDWRRFTKGNAPEIDGAYQWMPYEKGHGIREYSPIRIGTAIAGVNFGNETNGSVCVDGRKPRYAPHDAGKYRASLQALLEKGCNWIALDTWNEFHEGTQMCRTIEHGDTFINLAGEWSERFHTAPPAPPIKLFFMEQPAIFIIIWALGVLGWAAWSRQPKRRVDLHS